MIDFNTSTVNHSSLAKPAKPPQTHFLLGCGGWPYCGHFEPYKQFLLNQRWMVVLCCELENGPCEHFTYSHACGDDTIFYKFTASQWSPSCLLNFKDKTIHATIQYVFVTTTVHHYRLSSNMEIILNKDLGDWMEACSGTWFS